VPHPDRSALAESTDWDALADRLTDLTYLESRITTGGIHPLLADFNLVRRLPADHPRRRLLTLLREALTLDSVFLSKHPQAAFQALWNRCWWYDSPAAHEHYNASPAGAEVIVAGRRELKLHELLERWRAEKESREPGFPWLRSQRPPQTHLGSCVEAVFGRAMRFAFSPDGSRLATDWGEGPCSREQRVRVWEVATGRLLRELPGHEQMINGLTFSPDGRRLASASTEVKVWDVETGALVQTFRGHLPQYWANGSLQSREVAERLAAGEPKEILRGADLRPSEDGEICLNVQGPYIGPPVFLRGGSLMASHAHEARQTIRVWEVETGREVRCIECPDMWDLSYFVVSPDESRVLTGESRVGCLVIDLDSGEEVYREPRLASGARSRPVAVSPDGSIYAFGKSAQNEIKLVRAHDFTVLNTLRGHEDDISELAFSPDGALLASGAYDTTVCVWDVRAGTLRNRLQGHRRPGFQRGMKLGRISSISWSPDGATLATTADDGRLIVWEVASGRPLRSLPGLESDLRVAAFLPDGHRLVGSDHENVLLWDLENPHDDRELKSAVPSDEAIGPPRLSPDGRFFAFQLPDFTVRVMDVESGLEAACLRGPESAVWSVRWLPDARRLAAASKDGTIRIWDMGTGRQLQCMRGHRSGVNCLAVPPDGRCLASGGDDGTVRIWDPATGAELRSLVGHEAELHLVFFLKSGRLASFSGSDNTSRIWDVEAGRQLRVCPGDFEYHGELHESPDGRWIVYVEEKQVSDEESESDESESEESESTVVAIDPRTGETVTRFAGHGPAGIEGVAFHPDGERVATSGHDGTVRVWELATGNEHLCLRGHDGDPGPLRFDAAGDRLTQLPSQFPRKPEQQAVTEWNLRTEECVRRTTDRNEIRALEHPGERWFFGSTREVAEVREVATGRLLACHPVLVPAYYELDTSRGLMCLRAFQGSFLHLLKLEGKAVSE
jgi:WD40 repeat protein